MTALGKDSHLLYDKELRVVKHNGWSIILNCEGVRFWIRKSTKVL